NELESSPEHDASRPTPITSDTAAAAARAGARRGTGTPELCPPAAPPRESAAALGRFPAHEVRPVKIAVCGKHVPASRLRLDPPSLRMGRSRPGEPNDRGPAAV